MKTEFVIMHGIRALINDGKRQRIMRYSRAISQAKWSNGEKTDVSITISVIVLKLQQKQQKKQYVC
jgi:hypothetical protein